MKHGQLISLEAILTIVLFLSLFVVFYSLYSHLVVDTILSQDEIDKSFDFEKASQRLFYTQGKPHNWHALNLSIELPQYVGLQNGDGTFSLSKLAKLSLANATYYSQIKTDLAFANPSVDMYLRIYSFNGSTLVENTSLSFGVVKSQYSQLKQKEFFFAHDQTLHKAVLEVYYE